MPGFMMYTWGAIPFETYPLSLYEVQHVTATDWARKEIAGAAIYREWVGEQDEELHFRGKVFPHFIANHLRRPVQASAADMTFQPAGTSGGLGHLDVMDNMRRLGQAHALTRGDGWHLGWFVIEKLTRAHAHLGLDGIGQQIEFDVTFQRVPVPADPLAYFKSFWSAIS
jgi:phage protein U